MENEKKSHARIFNPAPGVFKISCKGDPGEEPNPATVTRMLLPQHRLGLAWIWTGLNCSIPSSDYNAPNSLASAMTIVRIRTPKRPLLIKRLRCSTIVVPL